MKRIKAHIHRANKKRTRNSDAEKLDDIQQHLTQQKLPFIRERALSSSLFSTKNSLRVPDLSGVFHGKMIIIELDGGIHSSLETPTKRTMQRNADYNRAGFIYIIINEESAKANHIELHDLASYRVWEVLSKLESEK